MAWNKIEKTRKAGLYEDTVDGVKTYLVCIGRKPPERGELPFSRDSKGLLIVKGSFWTYKCWPDTNHEEVKKAAYHLYNIHC